LNPEGIIPEKAIAKPSENRNNIPMEKCDEANDMSDEEDAQ
jgi:hypothetical protein